MPVPYRWIRVHGVRELPPWEFLDDQARALALRDEFLLEVQEPNPSKVRDWFPFAAHRARDEFAGFELVAGKATGAVCVVHLTWRRRAEQPGWPSLTRHDSFWAWFRGDMLDEAIEWADLNAEADVLDLEAERS
ncbi:MAG TPA: hypothetical protein VFQ53_36815 [Kofleriaceae bacterium]|nr:hypothetical protein [Kofleriaceae bacterium]